MRASCNFVTNVTLLSAVCCSGDQEMRCESPAQMTSYAAQTSEYRREECSGLNPKLPDEEMCDMDTDRSLKRTADGFESCAPKRHRTSSSERVVAGGEMACEPWLANRDEFVRQMFYQSDQKNWNFDLCSYNEYARMKTEKLDRKFSRVKSLFSILVSNKQSTDGIQGAISNLEQAFDGWFYDSMDSIASLMNLYESKVADTLETYRQNEDRDESRISAGLAFRCCHMLLGSFKSFILPDIQKAVEFTRLIRAGQTNLSEERMVCVRRINSLTDFLRNVHGPIFENNSRIHYLLSPVT